MTDDRAEAGRPRLSREEALRAFGWSLTTPVPASGGPLGFWLSYGTDIALPGEPAGSVAARATSYNAIAWNSLGEYEQARVAEAQSLVGYRISLLAGALGGHPIWRPEQVRRDGNRVTYRFEIAVRLHDDSGPLPWLGPVTELQTRGADNGIPPCFARALHGDLTIDLGQIPEPGRRAHPCPRPPAGGLWPRTRDARPPSRYYGGHPERGVPVLGRCAASQATESPGRTQGE